MTESSRPGVGAQAEENDPLLGRVRALLDLAARHSLAELNVEAGDFKLSLRTRAPAPGPPGEASAVTVTPLPSAPEPPVETDGHLITAPMIGTFYLAPAPGEPPFVQLGDTVETGQTVALIEAMKIMNEIQSDRAGVIEEVLVANGQGVEFGQPLFRLRPL